MQKVPSLRIGDTAGSIGLARKPVKACHNTRIMPQLQLMEAILAFKQAWLLNCWPCLKVRCSFDHMVIGNNVSSCIVHKSRPSSLRNLQHIEREGVSPEQIIHRHVSEHYASTDVQSHAVLLLQADLFLM